MTSKPRRIQEATQTHPVTFVAFDVLYTRSHMSEPLHERKERLFELVRSSNVLTPTMFVEGYPILGLTGCTGWERTGGGPSC